MDIENVIYDLVKRKDEESVGEENLLISQTLFYYGLSMPLEQALTELLQFVLITELSTNITKMNWDSHSFSKENKIS